MTSLTKIRKLGHCRCAFAACFSLQQARLVPLPEFQPKDDFRRALSWLIGQDVDPGAVGLGLGAAPVILLVVMLPTYSVGQ